MPCLFCSRANHFSRNRNPQSSDGFSKIHHIPFCPFKIQEPNYFLPKIDKNLLSRFIQMFNPLNKLLLAFSSKSVFDFIQPKTIKITKREYVRDGFITRYYSKRALGGCKQITSKNFKEVILNIMKESSKKAKYQISYQYSSTVTNMLHQNYATPETLQTDNFENAQNCIVLKESNFRVDLFSVILGDVSQRSFMSKGGETSPEV